MSLHNFLVRALPLSALNLLLLSASTASLPAKPNIQVPPQVLAIDKYKNYEVGLKYHEAVAKVVNSCPNDAADNFAITIDWADGTGAHTPHDGLPATYPYMGAQCVRKGTYGVGDFDHSFKVVTNNQPL